jgi:hypothetical protein
MYFATVVIIIATYYLIKLYNLYKIPEVWKDIPAIPFWERVYRTLTKPFPIDISFTKYMLPFMQELGVAVVG